MKRVVMVLICFASLAFAQDKPDKPVKPEKESTKDLKALVAQKKEGQLPADWKSKADAILGAVAADPETSRSGLRDVKDEVAKLDPRFAEAMALIEGKSRQSEWEARVNFFRNLGWHSEAQRVAEGFNHAVPVDELFSKKAKPKNLKETPPATNPIVTLRAKSGHWLGWRERVRNLARERKYEEALAVANAWTINSPEVNVAFPYADPLKADGAGHSFEDRRYFDQWRAKLRALPSEDEKLTFLAESKQDRQMPGWARPAVQSLWLQQAKALGKLPEDTLAILSNKVAQAAAQKTSRDTRIANARREAAKVDPRFRPVKAQLAEIDALNLPPNEAEARKAAALAFENQTFPHDERTTIFNQLRRLQHLARIKDADLPALQQQAEALVQQERMRVGANARSIALAAEAAGKLDPRWNEVVRLITEGLPTYKADTYFGEQRGYIMEALYDGRYEDALARARDFRKTALAIEAQKNPKTLNTP